MLLFLVNKTIATLQKEYKKDVAILSVLKKMVKNLQDNAAGGKDSICARANFMYNAFSSMEVISKILFLGPGRG